MDKLKKLLLQLGYTAEQVETLTAEEQKFDVKKMADVSKTIQREALENDEEFLSSTDERVRGQLLSSKEAKLIKMGLITKEEYDALPKEKRFDAALEFIAKRDKPAKGTEAAKAQEEIDRLTERVQALTGELETTKGEVGKAREGFNVEREFVRRFQKMDGLLIDVDDAADLAMRRLGSQYDFTIGKDGIAVLQKGTKLAATDKGNTERKLTLDDLLKGMVEEKKWAKKSNGQPKDEPVRVRHTGNGEEGGRVIKNPPPGLAAARAAAEARKAQFDKRGTRQRERAED